MNNYWVKYGINFIFIILLQGLIINQFQLCGYVYPMVYIVAILMLPFETDLFLSILLSLALGIGVDAMSDTFGLHTSSSLLIGYIRPYFLKLIKPRDGYDSTMLPTIHDMGKTWFIMSTGILLFIHHLWFFTIEILRFDLLDISLIKTFLSSIVSLFIILLLQYLFYKPTKQ